MRAFDYMVVPRELEDTSITNLLLFIRECKGKQDLWKETQPEVLASLLEVAKVQSTGASNRIEGIETTDKRLHDLVVKGDKPQTRAEEEIAGYRDALGLIHERGDYMSLTPNVILQLHQILMGHTRVQFAGKWKDSDNAIVARNPDGTMYVRFRPTPALLTPTAVESACNAYREARSAEVCDPLLLSLRFLFDFVSIHPFNDGNGRVSRLLTVLLMEQNGYAVSKYISIERLIERNKALYYESLADSSVGWNEGKNDEAPFVRYMLGMVVAAYRELSSRVETRKQHGSRKSDAVYEVFKRRLGKITKAMILEECPDISEITVKRALSELLKQGIIEKVGNGPTAGYCLKG